MSHDPTVTAAVVTIAGTAAIAIAGLWTTAWTTRRTIDTGERTAKAALASAAATTNAAIRGEREHRLWERRADVYIELISALNYHRDMRLQILRAGQPEPGSGDGGPAQGKAQAFANELEARLIAYGTLEVVVAFALAADSHRVFMDAVEQMEGAATAAELQRATMLRQNAAEEAGVRSSELVDLIRVEIQSMSRGFEG